MEDIFSKDIFKHYAKELIRFSSKPILSKIKNIKDIHQGESCYIVGDGISLKYIDFSMLPKKKAIACNYSIFHKEITSLDLLYAINYAPFFFKPQLGSYSKEQAEVLNLTSKLVKNKINQLDKTRFIFHLSNLPFLLNKKCYYLFDEIPIDENDNLKAINSFNNVIQSSIVLAIYLGFTDINLLGFDYTHSPSRSHHWYEKGKGIITDTETPQKNFLLSAKEFADISSITINAEAQGINHIFYKDLTGSEPFFRENIELASKCFLDAQSTFSDYKIY